MDARDYFPYGKPQVIPPDEFFRTYELLREADYRGSWLRDTALAKLDEYAKLQEPYKDKTHQDEIYYLWCLCLQAEIHDYYEDYRRARHVLEEEGDRLKGNLKENFLGFAFPPLLRQQLWVLILYAHCEYRSRKWDEAREILWDIRRQVEEHFPLQSDTNPNEPSYGLRARIAYSLGQVGRHLGDLRARGEFINAIRFTRLRLRTKTKKYAERPDREMKYANYVIAKAFSFGLAWASYHTGELQRALGAAASGSALLETHNDPVHRAYAHVMYAQILSAAVRPVRNHDQRLPEEIEEAIELLEEFADEKSSPLVVAPNRLARAQYVLAYAYFLAGRYASAEQRATKVYESKTPGRWRLECAALLTRILLAQGRTDEARVKSDELTDLAKARGVTDSQRAEALLCRADVLMQASRKTGQEIDKAVARKIEEALTEAAQLARNHPVLSTVCGLAKGRYYVLVGDKESAQEQLAGWKLVKDKIEQGYIQQLGDDLAQEISKIDSRLIIFEEELSGAGKHKDLDRKLKRWIVRMMFAKFGAEYKTKGARFLGVTEDTIVNWEKSVDSEGRGSGAAGGL